MSSQELWEFFLEIGNAGDLELLPKSDFLGRLPAAMEHVYGIKKCHSLKREGKSVRGFKSMGVREQELPPDQSCCNVH